MADGARIFVKRVGPEGTEANDIAAEYHRRVATATAAGGEPTLDQVFVHLECEIGCADVAERLKDDRSDWGVLAWNVCFTSRMLELVHPASTTYAWPMRPRDG
jgi:hypothetical protein